MPAPCFFSAPAPLTVSVKVASPVAFSATVPSVEMPPVDAQENASAPPIVRIEAVLLMVIAPL